MDAAVALMLSTEYDRIQMRDVAADAGVALGTTYRYFVSKEHLMAEALLLWSSRFPALSPPEREQPTVKQLKSVFRRAARAFAPHPTVYGTNMALQGTSDPWAASVYRQFGENQQASFGEHLPRVPSPQREQIIAVMSAVLDTELRSWARGHQPIDGVYTAIDHAATLLIPNE